MWKIVGPPNNVTLQPHTDKGWISVRGFAIFTKFLLALTVSYETEPEATPPARLIPLPPYFGVVKARQAKKNSLPDNSSSGGCKGKLEEPEVVFVAG